jgi:hypothetical protein
MLEEVGSAAEAAWKRGARRHYAEQPKSNEFHLFY